MKTSSKKMQDLIIGEQLIRKGERRRIFLHVASLFDYTELKIPIEVIRGKEEGPTLFISAAIHGDEINGVEIIKRLLSKPFIKRIKGTLILVPVVNVFGFNTKSRYLPDRRDLNRCFPGKKEGSLASRLAYIFMKEVVGKCTHGIDLHTGALHRTNLPQIRACLDDPETKNLSEVFGVPVVLHSELRDGSLREAARQKKIAMLLFEGGEALRFDEEVIRIGLKGCISVMKSIGMMARSKKVPQREYKKNPAFFAQESFWVRAPHSGSFRFLKKLGDRVRPEDVVAVISDPFGNEPFEVIAHRSGIIIGVSQIPLVNKGDAMFHIAIFKNVGKVKRAIEYIEESRRDNI